MRPEPDSLKILLFGGTGAIGGAISDYFRNKHWRVYPVTRRKSGQLDVISWNPLDDADTSGAAAVSASGPFDAVCWAQGANCSDSVYSFDRNAHLGIYAANVLYVLQSLNVLLKNNALTKPARLCIISSIWQHMARQEKLSYCVTKAALQGLVLSAANDLGRDGHLVNAVLPGVIDTPMTRRSLLPEQIERVAGSTQFGRLPTLADVAGAVFDLCSPTNTGITGQFINVDLGFSHVRIV